MRGEAPAADVEQLAGGERSYGRRPSSPSPGSQGRSDAAAAGPRSSRPDWAAWCRGGGNERIFGRVARPHPPRGSGETTCRLPISHRSYQ